VHFPGRWSALCTPEHTSATIIELTEFAKFHFLRFGCDFARIEELNIHLMRLLDAKRSN
jgi:hypothetical protein